MSAMKRHIAEVVARLTLVLAASSTFGVEPTHLEPAEEAQSEIVTLEQTAEWQHQNKDTGGTKTEIAYGLNRRLKLGLSLPAEYDSGDGVEFGDIGLFLEGIANPDASKAPLVGGEIKLLLPTGEESQGVGGKLQVRLSKNLGEDKKHGRVIRTR